MKPRKNIFKKKGLKIMNTKPNNKFFSILLSVFFIIPIMDFYVEYRLSSTVNIVVQIV